MQQVGVSDVDENGAAIPSDVLRALGVAPGDKVAFVENGDGSIAIVKAPTTPVTKRSISDIVGVFATGEQRSIEEELALLREIRYGDESDDHS